ncbi:hypothetical protein MUK42_35131 [Musa troglodytarum]|uniref:Uncharacterized protein n=1 Tax=Musa troglodytarum TaxID=320322 RepID=A0A9E7HJZ6_9LILI|nr:hypothetical protein MUK42_35131 [Musa troglodytarum]
MDEDEEEEEEVVMRLITLLATHLGETPIESRTAQTSHSHSMSRKAAMASGQIYRNGPDSESDSHLHFLDHMRSPSLTSPDMEFQSKGGKSGGERDDFMQTKPSSKGIYRRTQNMR